MMRMLIVVIGFAVLCPAQEITVVKNAPFSAIATTEITQTLADGNKITRTTTATIARDSEGRTRREQTIGSGALVAFIVDPIAKVNYVVEGRLKSARRIATPDPTSTNSQVSPARSEPLGSQVIDGIQAEGTRITRTLAAGEAGNELPLEIAVEAWYSKELQTAILTRTTDPRIGETVYRLTGIQRGEPDHTLFEVPGNYAVRDDRPSQLPLPR